MSLGKEIKKARIDKGWKQQDLQVATGLSQKYLSAVELDKAQPSFDVVKRIARALGVSLDTLAKEDEEATAPQPKRQQTRKAAPEPQKHV
jgi:transcriptional regulator with XRE-family HTH domain